MARTAILALAVAWAVTLITPGARASGEITALPQAGPGEQLATFAGGCFWCMESPFEGLKGVRSVVSGYSGGSEPNPTYKQVASGKTGHTESIQIVFDPEVIGYEKLLEIYWRSVDPTDAGGQFGDRGAQYRPEIFVHDKAQRLAAERSKRALTDSGRFGYEAIAVKITDYVGFHLAETYHQDYYLKDAAKYKRYRFGSGRDGFLARVWADDKDEFENSLPRYRKPSDAELKLRLDDLQYRVTQQDDTEPAFQNAYWDEKRVGIYVDVASGEPLFSSKHKFDSGTGWPSFYQPLVPGNIMRHSDDKLLARRTEVRSKHGDSHLGHVFDDGPAPTGLRYCINSAALRFVPVEELEKSGYAHLLKAFDQQPDQPTRR